MLFATSGHSGVDRVVQNLLPEFGRTSHRFDLLQIRGHGPYLEEVPDNVRVIRLPVSSKKTVLPCLLWYLWRHRPQAMLTANHELNRALLLARRLTGVPTRVVIRMGMSVTAKGKDLKPAQRKALFASMRRWYPLADAAVTPSQGVADDLIEIAGVQPERLSVIRNPIVNARFFRLAAEPVAHPWYGKADNPVILGVGSLEPRKDFATLIQAFALVRRDRRCCLIILGKGRQRSELLALAAQLGVADDVDLPGFDPNPYRHMQQAGLFVLASQREGASAVIVEALACGTPVVSTDCPSGPAETLANGRYGRLVPVGDVQAMAQAINATLKAPPDPDFLRQAVVANHTEVAAGQYLAALGVNG
nr:glycosyltransferase [Desulfurivibrio alkaliphilus]